MFRGVCALALAIAPVAAWGQTTTTTCEPYFGNVRCQSETNQGVDWSRGVTTPTPEPVDWDAVIEGRRQRQKARKAAKLREEVGGKIAAGDCAGAEQAALKAGDLDLAAHAKAYCQSAP
jgi:hypothetical protein